MRTVTTRCAIYLRVSLDATGEQLAVSRQREDCRKIAAARGWQVTGEFTDNSVSAYSKTKVRPGYDRLVQAYEAGEFGALVCWDLDRLTRQPRQLEDWIDRAEDRGLLLVTANGEADLSTDNGRLFARIKASVARAEVERKGARQQRALEQRATAGRPPLGVRLTGYTTDGAVVEHEAAVVRQIFERFHAGDSLRGIAAWLEELGVPTRSGRPWNPSSVRTVLTNPRYAGRAIYRGQVNGHAGTWPPLVEEWLFDMVQDRLSDPRRRKQVGTDRKHLGSGLYLCGVCDRPVRAHTSVPSGQESQLRYRCPAGGHITRTAGPIDRLVLGVLRARLRRPDLASVLAEPGSQQARAAAEQIRQLRARLRKAEQDYDNDLIDAVRYKAKTEKITAELDTAEAAQVRMMAGSNVAGTLTAPDPVAAFDASPLGARREVLSFFMTVRLDPAPRGRHFDPASVRIEWMRGE